MRNLTIKREKSFVACIADMQVYIEDPTSNELEINNVPCKKLGVVKNGKESTFSIGEESARVYVIADKLSKDYCNDVYLLPEGQDDIILSGKNRYNPTCGNAYRFHNNNYAEAKKNQEKSKRRGRKVMTISMICGGIVGLFIGFFVVGFKFLNMEPKEKVFTEGEMRITLTDEFSETDMEYFTVCYGSRKDAVLVLKEEFTLMEGLEDYSREEYAQLLLDNNHFKDTKVCVEGELVYFERAAVSDVDGKTYAYFSCVYKSDEAFWFMQFSTEAKSYEKEKPKFIEWAESVEFVKE